MGRAFEVRKHAMAKQPPQKLNFIPATAKKYI